MVKHAGTKRNPVTHIEQENLYPFVRCEPMFEPDRERGDLSVWRRVLPLDEGTGDIPSAGERIHANCG